MGHIEHRLGGDGGPGDVNGGYWQEDSQVTLSQQEVAQPREICLEVPDL